MANSWNSYFNLHVRIPAETKVRADEMAAEDASPHKVNFGRWITDLIEAEWARRHPEPIQPVRVATCRRMREHIKPAKKGKAKK